MSLTSNFHNIEALTTSSKPCENQRLVTIHYKGKTAADGTKIPKFPSLCASIPQLKLNLTNLPSSVAAVTISLWESLQDDLIRSLIDARRNKETPAISTKSSIHDDEISLEAIAAFAAATGNGKLSGDSIGQWFDATLTEPLLAALLASDPDRTDDQCAAILKNFRTAMQKLAAVQPGLTAADYKQLRKALATAPEEDVMSSRLVTKIDACDKAKAAMLDGL